MRADVFAHRNLGARRRWRTGFRLSDTAERQLSECRQRADGNTGTCQEAAAIYFVARTMRQHRRWLSTTLGFPEKHEYFSYLTG
jgi:hypothetical protein